MRFEQINITGAITEKNGIKEINMQRLSSVVALVGRNGSGKSRIIELIENNVFNTINIYRLMDNSISHSPTSIESLLTELRPFKKFFLLQEEFNIKNSEIGKNPQDPILIMEKAGLQRKLRLSSPPDQRQSVIIPDEINKIIKTLKSKYLRRIRYNEIHDLQKAIENNDESDLSFENLIQNITKNNNYNELKSINRSALDFLSKLPHQLAYDKFECVLKEKAFEDTLSYKRFQSLKKFVRDFLNKELSWEHKTSNGQLTSAGNNVTFTGIWTINNRLFDYNEFSDGEKTLFAYALLFFLLDQNPNLNIKESIILIDEPELHLHPDSEIDLIEGIKRVIGEKGQLIIATHSINILSMLNYEEIFMVKNGEITHPSQVTPGKSLSELMGIEERVHKLSDFLSSISTWTFVNFMSQCFSNPEVIQSSRAVDPQIEAFKKAVAEKSSKETNMLLDFGAGKGRLLEQISTDYDFINKINYSALEPEEEFHGKLTELGAKNVFNTYEELPRNSFDFILLCNVLHEIPLDEWEPSLNKVIDSLKVDGYLIIIETKVLSKGERIGHIGYLLLDIDELQQLFKLSSLPSSIKVEGDKNSITCAVMNKSELTQISRTDIVNTLIALEKNTLEKIEAIRNENNEVKESPYGLGRKTAFLSQQHINAKIAQRHIRNY